MIWEGRSFIWNINIRSRQFCVVKRNEVQITVLLENGVLKQDDVKHNINDSDENNNKATDIYMDKLWKK